MKIRQKKRRRRQAIVRAQRQYHRNNPHNLHYNGIWSPYCFKDKDPDFLTWWTDCGFILNKRFVCIWWEHPRNVYHTQLEEKAWEISGDAPPYEKNWLEGGEKHYVKRGKSRKSCISTTMPSLSEVRKSYFNLYRQAEKQLQIEGIDYQAILSFKPKNLQWGIGINLIAPMEVRNEEDVMKLVRLAKRLILRQTTLEQEFPNYQYGKEDWLKEQSLRDKDVTAHP